MCFSGVLTGGGSSHRGLLRNGAGLDTPVPPGAREPSQSGGLEGGGHSLPLPCRMGHPHSRDKDHILPAGNARAGRTVLSLLSLLASSLLARCQPQDLGAPDQSIWVIDSGL